MQTGYFLRAAMVAAITFTVLTSSSAKALEASCETFNKLLTHDQKYQQATVLDEGVPGIGFHGGFAYADSDRDRLVSLSTIREESGKYLAAIQLFPEIKLLAIARTEIGAKDFPKEISNALSGMSMTMPSRWKDNKLSPVMGNQCDRLQGIIPAEDFDDAKARIYVRHHVFGHRSSSGQKVCNGSNSEQLNFYEAFTPRIYNIKGNRVIVDGDYAGVLTNGEFKYPCLLDNILQGREKVISAAEADELEPPGNHSPLDYLEKKGVISHSERLTYDQDPKGSWEFQPLLNLSKGRMIFNQQQ